MKKTKTIRFVDCGGNVGQSIHWSLNILDAFSELFDCNVKVDCFEPYPQLFEIIKGRYSWAPTDKISLHQQAVDVKDGKEDFIFKKTMLERVHLFTKARNPPIGKYGFQVIYITKRKKLETQESWSLNGKILMLKVRFLKLCLN